MVCYARPASWLAAIVFVAWLVFAAPVSHFFNTAALMTAVAVVTVGAAGAAALAVATFRSARRRRAAAGGCVSCQFRCQHAMTEPTGRFRLVTMADRRPPASAADRLPAAPGQPGASGHPGTHGHPGPAPDRSVPTLLPMPTVRSAPVDVPGESGGLAAPRWPDRPAHRATQVSHLVPRTADVPQRERAGAAG
jgi:hypothetical protein